MAKRKSPKRLYFEFSPFAYIVKQGGEFTVFDKVANKASLKTVSWNDAKERREALVAKYKAQAKPQTQPSPQGWQSRYD